MKLDKDTKAFISEVVRYAVAEAIKQATEDAKKTTDAAKKPTTTFEQRREMAATASAKHAGQDAEGRVAGQEAINAQRIADQAQRNADLARVSSDIND